MTTFRQGH